MTTDFLPLFMQNSPDRLHDELRLRDIQQAHYRLSWQRCLAWGVSVLIVGWFLWEVANNANFGWSVTIAWFTEQSIMRGLYTTLWLAVVSMLIGTVLGLLVAIARLSGERLARGLAALYIWFFRGVPLLVQLIFWYNLSTLVPEISLVVPGTSIAYHWETNQLITPLTAAILGLAFNEAAYMAEIIRAGLLSVNQGQYETCDAFGMTRLQALRRIIIPQAMRAIIPPTGNQFISLIKATSLVSVIAMSDILYSVQAVYNRTFEVIPMLMVAVIWYLLVTSLLSVVQDFIEKYYSRGHKAVQT